MAGGALVVLNSFGVSVVCDFEVLVGGDVDGSVLLLDEGFEFMVGGVGGVGFVGRVGVCINKTPFLLISDSIVPKIKEDCTSLCIVSVKEFS